jgi:iron complex outermembrane receptor protein
MRKAVFIFTALLTGSCAFAQLHLSGIVRNKGSKEWLVNATVQLDGATVALTDAMGYFRFSNVRPGEHSLSVRYLGYDNLELTVTIDSDSTLQLNLQERPTVTDEVIVEATRAGKLGPLTHSTVNREQIVKQNFGQDLPILLNWAPSVVTTSDAGAGVGYTGIRIRGSDPTRINVTINGIPYNDSESLGTFWVDIPDIAASTQSIQMQRGVGTSTNGAGAFGATINLQTNTIQQEAYALVSASAGSFGTFKTSASFGTGLIDGRWTVDGRASRIYSEGFIDRASSDLSSYYLAAGYYHDRTLVKAITFGGKERTYQSWYGVPESRLNNDYEAMLTTAANEGWNEIQTENLLNSNSRTFNPYLYENQVDDYRQDHYQLHASHRLQQLTLNGSLHYTKGGGYYEEYRFDDDLAAYGLEDVVIDDDGVPADNDTIRSTDIIRRRWLDNDFYGLTFSAQHESDRLEAVFGGAWNRYDGKHFGEIIWSAIAVAPYEYQYYYSDGDKRDFNLFTKANYKLSERLSGFVDLQFRQVKYQTRGVGNKQNVFDIDETYAFFNPKLGLTVSLSASEMLYASYSVGNREPVRDDFVDNPGSAPKPEQLHDWEVGFRSSADRFAWSVNAYLMNYQDQLVPTGKLNDVGASVRTNVDKSYRAGIELEGKVRLRRNLTWDVNLTLSRNKIKEFTEVLYDYGVNWDEYNAVERTWIDTDISFSPGVVGGSAFTYQPLGGVELTLLTKYVGSQFLDNTSNDERSMDSYFTHDVRFSYTITGKTLKEVRLSLLLNNVTNTLYSSNGYTWGYLGGGDEYRENYYYPQAGFHFMTMLSVKI